MAEKNLIVSHENWMKGYTYDVSPYILRHTYKESRQKGGKEIWYISWADAIVLLKKLFPTFEICWERSEGNHVYHYDVQIDRFIFYPYIQDNETGLRSETVPYWGVDSSHYELTQKKLNEAKTTTPLLKNVDRALVRCIAVVTGIGLRLWTGEDVPGTDREGLIEEIVEGNGLYKNLTGDVYLETQDLSKYDVKDLTTLSSELWTILGSENKRKIYDLLLQLDDKFNRTAPNSQRPYIKDRKQLLTMKEDQLIELGKELREALKEVTNESTDQKTDS